MRTLVVAILLLASSRGYAQESGKRLGQPLHSVRFAVEIGGKEPRCENGFCLVHDNDSPRILIYDSSGLLLRSNDLQAPGFSDVSPWDMTISRSGLLAASAGAVSSDGRTSSFILLFDQSGPPKTVIRTDPFVALRIVLSHDGFVWALGVDPDKEDRVPWPGASWARGPRTDYSVFRRYTLEGRPAGEFIARSSLPQNPRPHESSREALAVLRASETGIGAYIPASREWVDLKNNGEEIGRFTVPPPLPPHPELNASEFGVTDSGGVYAFWCLRSECSLYQLNRLERRWDPIEGSARRTGPPLRIFGFLGSDGNRLLFKGGPVADFQSVVWFNEP